MRSELNRASAKVRARNIKKIATRILDRVECLLDEWPLLSQQARKERLKRFEQYTAAEIRVGLPCGHE